MTPLKQGGHILILAGDTDGNIGDRAIVYSMCAEFKRLRPEVKISIVSGNPAFDKGYFGVDAIPRGIKGILNLLGTARKSDLIVCGGGGLFQDDDSLVKMPYWFFRIALLRLVSIQTRIIAYSLGVGPLRSPLTKCFARLAFACMDIISVRDLQAKQTAAHLTSKPIHIVPDPALLLPAAPKKAAYEILRAHDLPLGKAPLIGVAVRHWFHQNGSVIPHKYAFKYRLRSIPGRSQCEKMVALLADVLDRLAANHGAFILFLPTYNVMHEADDKICLQVMTTMKCNQKRLLRIRDPLLYKAVSGCLDVMLGGRMHPTILAASAGTNIVGLSYNQKFSGFFGLLGLCGKIIDLGDFVDGHQAPALYGLLTEAMGHNFHVRKRAGQVANVTRRFNADVVMPLLALTLHKQHVTNMKSAIMPSN